MAGWLSVLTFHDLSDARDAISYPATLFGRIMMRLAGEGFTSMTISQVADTLARRHPLPDRTLAITFDDGFESTFTRALPVLRDLGMTATVFVLAEGASTEGLAGRPAPFQGRDRLSWDEVEHLQQHGWEIGAHGISHTDLTRLSPAAVDLEVSQAKELLEARLGVRVTSFAYPFGRHTPSTVHAVRRRYRCACSDELGLVHGGTDTYRMERLDAYYFRSPVTSAALVRRWLPCYVKLRAWPRRLRRRLSARDTE